MRYLVLLFAFSLSLNSCSENELLTPNRGIELRDQKKGMSSQTLAEIHAQVATEMNRETKVDPSVEADFDQLAEESMGQLNKYGVESFAARKGLSTQVEAFEFYHNNVGGSKNIYDDLGAKFSLSEDEARELFIMVELYDAVEAAYGTEKAMSFGCGLALVANTVHTLSAVAVTTPVGLGFWLAGKALGIASIAASCA